MMPEEGEGSDYREMISELEEMNGEDGEEWNKVKKKMKRVKRSEWKKVDICNVEGEVETKGARTIKVDFQVAAVKKPLISVKRICEKGNRVCFGPEDGDNFVMNVKA